MLFKFVKYGWNYRAVFPCLELLIDKRKSSLDKKIGMAVVY